MVATMNEALGKLQVASNSGDLAALQDGLNFEVEKKIHRSNSKQKQKQTCRIRIRIIRIA